jgi:AcrR family transcriptional regulator
LTAAAPISRRERKKQLIRERICEETVNLIAMHGIEGTTIDAICDCADIAKKTFYNYYSAKHDLMLDICATHLLSRTDVLVKEAMEKRQGLRDRLHYIFTVMKDRNQNAGLLERELITYLVSGLAANINDGANHLSFMNECFAELFRDNQEEIKDGCDPEFCAELTVGAVNAMTLNWLHHDDYPVVRRFDQTFNFIIEGIIRED